MSLTPETERVSIFCANSSEDIMFPSIHNDITKDSGLILEIILFPSVIIQVFTSELEGLFCTRYSSTSIIESLQQDDNLLIYSLQASLRYFSFNLPTHIIFILSIF